MPQMAPTLWMILLIYSFTMLIFMFSFMYFNKNISVNNNYSNKKNIYKYLMMW